MIFDTDILIWIERGNIRAAKFLQEAPLRTISLQTYLELMQCAKDKKQQKRSREFLRDFRIRVLPLSEKIGFRASVYIDQFSCSHGLHAGDAIIAATAVEYGLQLCSANIKHYKVIPDLDFKAFKPG